MPMPSNLSPSSPHKSLNPEAPEFIPSIFISNTTINFNHHSFYPTPPCIFPPPHHNPPNTNNLYCYYMPPPVPPYTDPFLHLPPPPPPQPHQPFFPIPKPPARYSLNRERVVNFNCTSNLRKFTWRRKISSTSSYSNDKSSNSAPVATAAAYDDQHSTSSSSTGNNVIQQHQYHDDDHQQQQQVLGKNEKIARIVKYGESGHRGQHFEVVQLPSHSTFPTVMIRNIPSKYTRRMLLQFLDEHCVRENEKETARLERGESESETPRVWSAIDFLYLPMDFKSGWNKSYAFVNFTDARAAWKFYNACHNGKWDLFRSSKIREIACAKIQGKEALVEHFGHTAFACDYDEYLPISFDPPRDGSKKDEGNCIVGDQEISTANVVGKRISFWRYQSPLQITVGLVSQSSCH